MKQIRSSNLGSTFSRAIYLLLIVGLACTMVGCTSWRDQFLGESVNRATANDVASKLEHRLSLIGWTLERKSGPTDMIR